MKYLSQEEQYEDVLNDEQIKKIEDIVLRDIRQKYWDFRKNILSDTNKYTDEEWVKMVKKSRIDEKIEIEEYKKKRNV